MQHIIQQFENGTNGIGINHVLGQFQVSSVRIEQRYQQLLKTVNKMFYK